MKPYGIVRHAVLMLWNNRADVIRLFAPVLVVAVLMPLIMIAVFGIDVYRVADGEPNMDLTLGQALAISLTALFQGLVALWVLVAWHRYVLLQEAPRGWISPVPGDRVLAYFGTWVLFSLLLMFGTVAAGLVIALLVSMLGESTLSAGVAVILGIVLFAAIVVVALRLSVALPAAAIGRPIGLKGAWRVTQGNTPGFLGVFGLGLLLSLALSVPLGIVGLILPVSVVVILDAVLGVVFMIFGASVMTTLYGVFVEKRELS